MVAGLLAAVLGWAAAGCGNAAVKTTGHSGGEAPQLRGLGMGGLGMGGLGMGGLGMGSLGTRPAPAGWRRAELPGDGAALAYPPGMRPVPGDRGTISVARFSPSGAYLMYLNATPRQGAESLRDWASFRVSHLLDDDASSARRLASRHDVRFAGGTGSCVEDTYVTKVGRHHYAELACLVDGRTRASVIVAAAPSASWARVSGVLIRSVDAYQVR